MSLIVKDYLMLLRAHQWYKNLLVFLVLPLSGAIFYPSAWFVLFLAFISLCLISSVNYIINDTVDAPKDRLDSVKKNRPIAAGRISTQFAIFTGVLLFILSLLIAYMLDYRFMILVIALFVLTQIYTFYLKNKIFIDIIMIAINFMIRAVTGAVVIGTYITSWFISGIFFLAMFLVFIKRYGEAASGAQKNRATLEFYTIEITRIFSIVFLAIVILLYTIYVIISHDTYYFVATVPVFTYLMLRYFGIAYSNPDYARHAEKMIKRPDLILPGILWLLMFVFALFKYRGFW